MHLANLPILDGLTGLPPLLWVLVHYSTRSHEQRIRNYGLTARHADAGDLERIVMHAFVHAHDTHLAQNVASYIALAGTLTVPAGLRRVGFTRASLGTLLFVGGAAMGIWATLADIDQRNAEFRQRYGLGIGVIESIVGGVHSAFSRSTFFCGGSAAITAFAGFRAFADGNPVTTIACFSAILSDVVAIVDPSAEPWFALLGGTSVAHASHLGGFVFGALVAGANRLVLRTLGARPRTTDTRGRRLGDP